MKKLILTIVVALLIATPALAYQEGPDTDWWYIDASYGDYHVTVPLVIEIDGNPADGQIFAVGETITITCELHSYAGSAAGGADEAYLDWELEVTGPGGSGSVGDYLYDYDDPFTNNKGYAEVEAIETLTIVYTPTTPGVYTVDMDSYAAISQYWTYIHEDWADDTLIFQVLEPDPEAGFVTGGGWIDSPEGAYMPDPSLTGKANFGFVSKYKKGATVPTGQTEFVFKVGDLNFHSESYDWLLVTGSNYAKFKGEGTINGEGSYKFQIWAGDDDPDTFRIKIWYEDGGEVVVYDNGMDQAIGGGSIVIHTN